MPTPRPMAINCLVGGMRSIGRMVGRTRQGSSFAVAAPPIFRGAVLETEPEPWPVAPSTPRLNPPWPAVERRLQGLFFVLDYARLPGSDGHGGSPDGEGISTCRSRWASPGQRHRASA